MCCTIFLHLIFRPMSVIFVSCFLKLISILLISNQSQLISILSHRLRRHHYKCKRI